MQVIFRENDKSEFKKHLLNPKNQDIAIRGGYGFMRFPRPPEKAIYIAGGVSVAPVLSIVRRMVEDRIPSDIELILANHSKEEEFYIDELAKIPGLKFKNLIGKITKEDITIDLGAKYHVLGPQNMVNGVNSILSEAKIKRENIIFEEYYPSVAALNLDIEASSYFKMAVDQAINHVVITDINGVILYANQGAMETTGFSFDEMKGQTPRLWGGLMDKSDYNTLWKTISIDQKPYRGELRNQRKNGEIYDVLAVISPIKDTNGALLGYLGIEQDITQMKQNEIDFKNVNDLMINRELKIIELKAENAELKKKLGL